MALQTIEFIPAVGDDHATDLREGTERIWPSPAPAANDYYMVVPNYITILNTFIDEDDGDAVAYAPADYDGIADGHQLALGAAGTVTTLAITFTPSGGDAQTINVSVYRRPDANTELIEEVVSVWNMIDTVKMLLAPQPYNTGPVSDRLRVWGRISLHAVLDGLEAFKAQGIPGERHDPTKEYYFTEYQVFMHLWAETAEDRAIATDIIKNKLQHVMNLIPGINAQFISDGRSSLQGDAFWALSLKLATTIKDTVLVPEVDNV